MTFASSAAAMKARLLDYQRALHRGAAVGVAEVAEEWLAEGDRIIPLEEGVLANSGQTAADGLRAGVGWGKGAARDYTLIQHERTDFRHDPGRSAKWGEIGRIRVSKRALQIIGNAIQRATG